VAWIPRYKKALADPIAAVKKVTSTTALTSLFITGSIGSAWAACCLLQTRNLDFALLDFWRDCGLRWIAAMMFC
jgi:hypothetical protein